MVPVLKGESATGGASPDAQETRWGGCQEGKWAPLFLLFFPEVYVKEKNPVEVHDFMIKH